MRTLALVALLLVALGGVAAADGPVAASATLDKRGITIGDPIQLILVVEAGAGYQITDNGIARNLGEFEVLDAQKPEVTRLASGRTRFTFKYRISAFRVGDLVFPAISVAYQAASGAPGVVATSEVPVVVTTVIQPGESVDDIKPLKPQLRVPGSAPQIPAIAIQVALAIVVLLMLALIVRQTLRRAKAAPVAVAEDGQLTPAQRAMAELNRVDRKSVV